MVGPDRSLRREFAAETSRELALLRLRSSEEDRVAGNATLRVDFGLWTLDFSRSPECGSRWFEHDRADLAGIVLDPGDSAGVERDTVRPELFALRDPHFRTVAERHHLIAPRLQGQRQP